MTTRTALNPATLRTLDVLAGAYKRKSPTLLSHAAVLDADGCPVRVLCSRVDVDHLADIYSNSDEKQAGPPTCPQCLRRDPRHNAK